MKKHIGNIPTMNECKDCKFYKEGYCEKYSRNTDPEALCKQYEERK